MAITLTATPKIGGGLGNSKVIKFSLSGTYVTGGFAVDFDPTDAVILVNGFYATYDSTNKKILLKTIATASSTTTATEVANSTSVTTQGIIIY